MAEIADLINFAVNKNPIEFASAFSDIVHERAARAIENKKIEVASSLYGDEDQEEDLGAFDFEDDTLDLGDEEETPGLEESEDEDA